jgi:hypothetical protein
MKNTRRFFSRLCALVLVAGAWLATAATGRSQVSLTLTATDATYSNVTATFSGTFSTPGDFDLYYANLLLVGFTNATAWSSTASVTTLAQASSIYPGTLTLDTLAYSTTVDPNTGIIAAGAYIQANAEGSDSSIGNPMDYSGTATFDLSAIAGQLSAGTGDLVAEIQSGDDSSFSSQTVGTWALSIEAVPEPGTVVLGGIGLGLAAFALRRRRAVAA